MSETELVMKKSLLIIKASKQSVTAAETFLKNREWKVLSTTNLKEALTFLVTHKPTFVMVGIDHPNKKIRSLPKILSQAFPVCVIAFVEQSTATSYRLLQESACIYKVNPPVTGPAVERTVNKYVRDQERLARGEPATDELDTKTAKEQSSVIKIKHDTISGSGQPNTFSVGGASSSVTDLLAQLQGDDTDNDSVENEENALASTTDSIMTSGVKSPTGPMILGQDKRSSGEQNPADYNSESQGDSYLGQQGMQQNHAAYTPDHSDSTSGGNFQNAYNPSDLNSTSANNQTSKKHHNPTTVGYIDPDDEKPLVPLAEKSGKGALILGKSTKQGPGPEQETHSLIVKGTAHAMDEIVSYGDGKVKETVESSTNVACIVVESPRFSGYLVAALGKNRKIDDQFIQGIREKLYKFLRDSGETIDHEENLNIKIKQVDFEGWAIEYAQFLRKSVHNGDEVAMAFFPFQGAKTEVGESVSKDMATVKIDDIKADVVVDFNLYVYLPANNKYVLYTPKGSVLYSKQKDRLISQGVKEMHMLKAEVQDFSRHRAQNHLNGIIDEYQSKDNKTSKNAS